MLIHFPVALWPAHGFLHLFSSQLPAGISAIAGFWLLAAGTAHGWTAAFCGAADLLAIWRKQDRTRLASGLTHGLINGTVLIAFMSLFVVEYARYPAIAHGTAFLGIEGLLVLAMFLGNYFGASARSFS
jgi:uncharacterized membrane protein